MKMNILRASSFRRSFGVHSNSKHKRSHFYDFLQSEINPLTLIFCDEHFRFGRCYGFRIVRMDGEKKILFESLLRIEAWCWFYDLHSFIIASILCIHLHNEDNWIMKYREKRGTQRKFRPCRRRRTSTGMDGTIKPKWNWMIYERPATKELNLTQLYNY